MTNIDLLSDTVYREEAIKQLDGLLGDCESFPVKKTQIYGLRQIARQEPTRIADFARHQRERTERKHEQTQSGRADFKLQTQMDFWNLVERLCDPQSEWSVFTVGKWHAPAELRDENIPKKVKGMDPSERTRMNQLKGRKKEWLRQWAEDHVPAFFERFCTDALYRLELSEDKRKNKL